MSKKSQANKKLKKAGAPSPTGSNARERARLQAQAEKRRKDRMTLIIAGVIVVALVVGGGLLFSWFQSTRTPTAGNGATVVQDAPQELVMNQPIVFGEPDAPNTISVWADFHCPHCVTFEKEYGPTIEQGLATGEWKQEAWPMAFLSAGSATAANAFGCATQEGFGMAYQKALFENSNLEWNNDQLIDLAEQVNGEASETFTSCVQNLENGQWGESINATSRSMGVTGTPTVRINGEPVSLQELTPQSLADRMGVQ